ncbi:MAG: metallophosphoesterase [Cyanobacteria bacterium J06621_11]
MLTKRRTLITAGLGTLATFLGKRLFQPLQLASSATEIELAPIPSEHELRFRFVALGDVGTGERRQYMVANALNQRWQQSPFSTALLTGDNIYPNGEIERIENAFEQPYAGLLQNNVLFRAALGNHDYQTHQGEDQIAYPGYNMPSRYYTFQDENVQFFALDTNQSDGFNSEMRESPWADQLQWLEAELEKSTADWKVVFGHHPVFSSGRHGSQRDLLRSLSPILTRHGVQLYLNGHDHNYERTKPIDGTTYITTGNAAKLRPVKPSSITAHASSQLGFTDFSVYSDKIVVRAVDKNNNIYDEANIQYS